MQSRGFAPGCYENTLPALQTSVGMPVQGPKARFMPAWGEAPGFARVRRNQGLQARLMPVQGPKARFMPAWGEAPGLHAYAGTKGCRPAS
jgi:hypothetical protein